MVRALGALALFAALLMTPHAAPAESLAITVSAGRQFTPGDLDPYAIQPAGQEPVNVAVLPLMVPAGNDLIHLNRDLDQHNLTALDLDQVGRPLFAGQTIGQNQASMITTSHLGVGEYEFFCTIHSEMKGMLTVM